jgi:hypothetical protein
MITGIYETFDYPSLSQLIPDYPRLSRLSKGMIAGIYETFDYPNLSQLIPGYPRLSLTIPDYSGFIHGNSTFGLGIICLLSCLFTRVQYANPGVPLATVRTDWSHESCVIT